MSRFWDCGSYDGDGMPPELWQAVVRRAMNSPRGQKVLRELEAALLALPEKRLAEGILYQEGQCCALGALALHRVRQGGLQLFGPRAYRGKGWKQEDKERREFIATEDELDEAAGHFANDWESAEFGERMGIAESLAWKIAYWNDEDCEELTGEERYEKMLEIVRSKIKAEV